MKKHLRFLALLLALVLLLSGCGKPDPAPAPDPDPAPAPEGPREPLREITYANLADETSRSLLTTRLRDAGVPEDRVRRLMDEVDYFNKSVDPAVLTEGFETAEPLYTRYDPYDLQDAWDAAHPDFVGYNCRITALEVFGGFVTAAGQPPADDDTLFMDRLARGASPLPLGDEDDLFYTLYGSMATEASQDVEVHSAVVRRVWEERGVRFTETESLRLICVFFHDVYEPGSDLLFVGHAGILLPGDGELLFLEKVSFQEPYRLLKFRDRTELSDYLMEKYDVSWGQPTAPPFIMENDQLLDGYRPNPLNTGE